MGLPGAYASTTITDLVAGKDDGEDAATINLFNDTVEQLDVDYIGTLRLGMAEVRVSVVAVADSIHRITGDGFRGQYLHVLPFQSLRIAFHQDKISCHLCLQEAVHFCFGLEDLCWWVSQFVIKTPVEMEHQAAACDWQAIGHGSIHWYPRNGGDRSHEVEHDRQVGIHCS